MDAATAARMSDPDRNQHFRRRWVEPTEHPAVTAPRANANELGAIGIAMKEALVRRRQRRRGAGWEYHSDA